MDLKSKLEMFKNNKPVKPVPLKNSGCDIHDLVEGTVCTNDAGSSYVIENRYPLTYLHGGYPLGKALGVDTFSLKRICADLDADLSLQHFLFLDTETTGLSGGAGTIAFLIGIGFFSSGCFVLRQYFMRDYDEEASALEALNEIMKGFKGLVTFNGKSFDWNLLQSRFVFNRMRPLLKEPYHIDLLFPSRRIWKLKLESCSLSSLEENILGEHRVDDIPGALIPDTYFKYLEDRDAGEIIKVIRHNQLDIISMVALLVKISNILKNPIDETDGAHELLGAGKIFEAGGERDIVLSCYQTCLESENYFVKEAASKRLVQIYKRSRNYNEAIEHCCRMLPEKDRLNMSHLPLLIELAKLYEHRTKNISGALEIVEIAIGLSRRAGLNGDMYREDLKKRHQRLKRKSGRCRDELKRQKPDNRNQKLDL